jgi:GDP-4-dehydro-6-deoxy-D-mannose reductase
MRILITGGTGFVGSHLIERLKQGGQHELHALGREAEWPRRTAPVAANATLHCADMTKRGRVEQAIQDIRPEWVFHLAGYANTGRSFHEPEQAWIGNWLCTFNLYEAIAQSGLTPRILFVSSGLIYGGGGPATANRPITEDEPLQPASPYASSKAAADLLSYQVACYPGLDVVRVRCFNQIGPLQAPDYATANFARQVAAIERGLQAPVLATGDLSGQRDLTDVRDMVRAFVLLMEAGQKGEAYNAGSGVTHSMQSILERMLRLTAVPVEVRQRLDPARRTDAAVARADFRKLREATGWAPEFTLDHSLADLLDYWRKQPNEALT